MAGDLAFCGEQQDMPGQGDTGGKGIPRTETVRQREPGRTAAGDALLGVVNVCLSTAQTCWYVATYRRRARPGV